MSSDKRLQESGTIQDNLAESSEDEVFVTPPSSLTYVDNNPVNIDLKAIDKVEPKIEFPKLPSPEDDQCSAGLDFLDSGNNIENYSLGGNERPEITNNVILQSNPGLGHKESDDRMSIEKNAPTEIEQANSNSDSLDTHMAIQTPNTSYIQKKESKDIQYSQLNERYRFSWQIDLKSVTYIRECIEKINEANVYQLPKCLPINYQENISKKNIESSLINDPNVPTFIVRFYTFMAENLWQQVDDISIRICGDNWNNFQTSYGSFRPIHRIEYKNEHFYVFFAKFHIPIFLVNQKQLNLPYKYYLSFKKEVSSFEGLYFYLHTRYNEIFNRLLRIDLSSYKNLRHSVYTKFDLIILPNKETQGIWRKVEYGFHMLMENVVAHQSFKERMLLSMIVFLPKYFRMGRGYETCNSIEEFFERFIFFRNEFTQNQLYSYGNKNEFLINPIGYNLDNEKRYLSSCWLKKYLFLLLSEETDSLSIFIYVSITILIINEEFLDQDLNLMDYFVKLLLNCVNNGIEITPFQGHFIEQDKSMKTIHEGFVNYVLSAQYYKKQHGSFIKLFPFYHSMFYTYIDFNSYHIRSKHSEFYYWGVPEFFSNECNSIPINNISTLIALFKHNYNILQYTILFYSDFTQYPYLIDSLRIPYSDFLKKFLYFTSKNKLYEIHSNSSQLEIRRICFDKILSAIQNEYTQIPIFEFESIFDLSIQILLETGHHLKYIDQQYIVTLLELISNTVCVIYDRDHDSIIDSHIVLKKKGDVLIFLQKFCANLTLNTSQIKEMIAEFKRWEIVISLEFPIEYDWNAAISVAIRSRLASFSEQQIFSLICNIHSDKHFSQCLKDVVIYEVSNRISMGNHEKTEIILHSICCADEIPDSSYSQIFSKIMLSQKDIFISSPFTHLLKWNSWLFLFPIYFSEKSGILLSDEAISFFSSQVLGEFAIIFKKILSFTILRSEIEQYDLRKEYFTELLAKSQPYIADLNLSIEKIVLAITTCSNCLSFFNQQVRHLHIFKLLPVEIDMPLISSCDQSINQICTYSNSKYTIVLDSNFDSLVHSDSFRDIANCNPEFIDSDLIKYFINIKAKELDRQIYLYDDFIETIWIPAINELESLLNQLSDLSVKITLIKQTFDFKRMKSEIISELNIIRDGIFLLRGFNYNISQAVEIIPKFFTLISLSKTVELLNLTRKKYEFTGDFSMIQHIEDTTKHMDNMNLRDIPLEVFEKNSVLIELNTLHQDLLSAYNDSSEFVLWIKTNMPEIKDVKSFVDLASTTCGENPLDFARVTCLLTVCTELQPLIYLPMNTDLSQFITELRNLTPILAKSIDLPEKLRNVSNSLNLWKDLICAKTMIEENTMSLIEKIVTCGILDITLSSQSHEIEDIVKLTIHENKVARVIDFNQLNEYLSKFMLLSKGSSYKTKCCDLDLNIFPGIFEKLLIFIKVLHKLHKLDHPDYVSFSISIPFNEGSNLDEKTSIAQSKLREIVQYIDFCRKKEYFLSYYTTSQLVYIKKILNSSLAEKKMIDDQQIFHLLSIVNPGISKDLILCTIKWLVEGEKAKSNHSVSDSKYGNTAESESTELTEEDTILCKKVKKDHAFTESHIYLAIRELKKEKNKVLCVKVVMKWCNRHRESEFSRENEANDHDISEGPTEGQVSFEDLDEYKFETFNQIGAFLSLLNTKSEYLLKGERKFPDHLVLKEPNLIFLPSDEIFNFTIYLYSLSHELPSPSHFEILICEETTTCEEIEIFLKRALTKNSRNYYHIYCLLHVQKLSFETSKLACQSLIRYIVEIETHPRYKLVILCSEDEEQHCYMASALSKYKKLAIRDYNSDYLSKYLAKKQQRDINSTSLNSSDPDYFLSRLVISNTFGAGKSIYIKQIMTHICNLNLQPNTDLNCSTINLYGTRISQDSILKQLIHTRAWNSNQINFYHIDIASTIQQGIDSLLFKLIVLGCVTNSSGLIWSRKNTDFYVFELTMNLLPSPICQFIELFPYFHCIQPNEILNQPQNMNKNRVGSDVSILSKTEFQRVYSYLKLLDTNADLDHFVFDPDTTSTDYTSMVQVIISQCGICDPSWKEISYFVEFLNKQLIDCEKSSFCQMAAMEEEWRGFKSFVLHLMIHMSRDFATPSLERSTDSEGLRYTMIERRRWENSSHPYIFFNPDGHTMTFLGFWVDGRTTNLLNSDDTNMIIEKRIMSKELFFHLQANGVNLNENFTNLSKKELILKLTRVMGCEHDSDPDPNYVITLDNARKILGIHMRFRCNIPVIIMGETGCGKTHLIEYMCALQAFNKTPNNLLIMKIHGGTTDKEIIETVSKAQTIAKYNREKFDIDTIVFFDEANTSPNISLIKEIMCDYRIYGKHISQQNRLQFIAACNPYRRHSDEMILKLNQAGLGYFKNNSDTSDRIGTTPLRDLVYRVMELPESLGSLVWDFGSLNKASESKYIFKMVTKYFNSITDLRGEKKLIRVLSNILCEAQNYMRRRNDECSYVSLRDVDRTMRVMLWFYSKLSILNPVHSQSKEHNKIPSLSDAPYIPFIRDIFEDNSEYDTFSIPYSRAIHINEFDLLTSSVILAISVCYRSRLQERKEFDVIISNSFEYPLQLISEPVLISELVDMYYTILYEEMDVEANIADNHALKENIFMMFICTETKIPLFIVGKPGSSKSLSKTIISDSMQGKSCSIDGSILAKFKQVHMISYQCSHLSTSEGIIDVFKKCAAFQKGRNPEHFVSCVVLDEVGLAEDSPKLPLKVLHPLLDDSIYIHQNIVQSDLNQENDPNTYDFKMKCCSEADNVAFIGISNWALDPAKMNRGIMLIRDEPKRDQLITTAEGILNYGQDKKVKHKVKEQINWITDSYLNLLSSIQKRSNSTQDFYGLRDFYSLIKMVVFLCKKYNTKLNSKILKHSILRNFSGIGDINPLEFFDTKQIAYASSDAKGPDSSTLSLIQANLTNYENNFYGQNRYLLLLTENLAALDIVLSSPNIWPSEKRQDIVVLFGSSFPDDQDYSVICRNINKIKIYMETGKTVILINLDNLYESLYDALNQYYMKIYGNRYIDLGLGTHRVKCKVHDNFKLIIIADQQTVFQNFPPPLINRLEKHTLLISTILPERAGHLVNKLSQWALDFSLPVDILQRKGSEIKIGNCFIGYQTDTAAAIIYNVIKEFKDNFLDEKRILDRSKSLLLKLATVDAVLRLEWTNLKPNSRELEDEYFNDTKTITLEQYLYKVLAENSYLYFIQATTHSRLLNENDIYYLKEHLKTVISVVTLQQFRTNQEYVKEILNLVNISKEEMSQIIIIQSESGELNKDLISSVRYTSYEEICEWRKQTKSKCKIILVILAQLQNRANGSVFSSYHGRDVDSIHIDSILTKDNILPPLQDLIKTPLHELFSLKFELSNQKDLLAHCIQPSISCIEDSSGSEKRSSSRLIDVVNIFQDSQYHKILSSIFSKISTALARIHSESESQSWIKEASTCWNIIHSSGSFQKSLLIFIYKQVIPIFTELLALLDRNGNLLLYRNRSDYPEKLSSFWEILFSDEIFIFSIEDHLTSKRVPMQNDSADGNFFQASFPFSWLIFKNVSELWYTAFQRDSDTLSLSRFQDLFDNTPIGKLVNETLMKNGSSKDCLMLYLKDFIRMSFHSCDDDQFKVYEVTFQSYFDLLIENLEKDSNEHYADEQIKNEIIISIPLIHYSYQELRKVFAYLQYTFSYNSKICKVLSNDLDSIKDYPKRFRSLYRMEHLTMELIISSCKFNENKVSNSSKAEEYTQEIRSYNEIFSKGFYIDRSYCINEYMEHRESLRSLWDEILVIYLFISKISLKKGLALTVKSLTLLSKLLDEADFTSDDPITDIIGNVGNLYIDAQTSKKYDSEGYSFLVDLGECISEFLRSVITTVILKYELQENLIIYLTKFITLDLTEIGSNSIQGSGEELLRKKTEYIPPFHLKMFILHFLLRNRQELVMTHISKNLEELGRKASSLEKDYYLKNIYLMLIYSIEDSHFYTIEEMPKQNHLAYASEQLSQIDENSLTQTNILKKLESVARFRFLTSFILSRYVLSSQYYKYRKEEEFILKFKKEIELNCHKEIQEFLFRSVYLRIGFDIYLQVNCNKGRDFSWIIPREKRLLEQVVSPDIFLIYGNVYESLHHFLEDCIRSEEIPIEKPEDYDLELFALSMFDYALNFNAKNPTKSQLALDKTFHSILDDRDSYYFDIDDCIYLRIKNSIFNKILNSEDLRNQDIAIARLLFHVGTILISHKYPDIFVQIALIWEDPECIQKTYFPTMKESGTKEFSLAKEFSELEENLTGNWYACKNGHVYFIGDCGMAWIESICPECGDKIGGYDHDLIEDNICLTQKMLGTGYTLKDHNLKNLFYYERNIPPIAVVIIQIFLHSTFLDTLLSDTDESTKVSCLFPTFKGEKDAHIKFFTQRLSQDISHLMTLTQKSCDEALLCIHLILHNFKTTNSTCHIYHRQVELNFKSEDRIHWESLFYQHIIQPALKEADCLENPNVQRFLIPRSKTDSQFWQNRSLICVDNYKLAFLSQPSKDKQKFPIQNKLMKTDYLLMLTKYLPDIIRLQTMLMKDFGYRIDKNFAMGTTFEDMLKSLAPDKKSVVDEYNQCVNSLFDALTQTTEDLFDYGKISFTKEEILSINNESPLIYFLLSSAKESSLIFSLINLLVCIHNAFIHEYENKETSYKAQKINLFNVQKQHMINFQDDFLSLILSHVNYPVALSEGNTITYRFESIEEEFGERFIRMAPIVLYSVTLFPFKREAYDPIILNRLQEHIKQEIIDETIVKFIIETLDSIDIISEILSLVDVIIGFLASAGGDPNYRIFKYITDVLCYEDTYCSRIKEIISAICLKHLLHFWNILSFEKAKKMALNGQVPFGNLENELFEQLEPETITEINSGVNKYHVETLLHQLHDFIQFKMRMMERLMLRYDLKTCMKLYAEDNNSILPQGFMEYFPGTPKVSQTIAVWTQLIIYESQKI